MSKDVRKALMIAKGQVSSGYLPPGDPQRTANLSKFMEGAHPEVLNKDGTPKTLYHGSIEPNLKRLDPRKAVEVEGGSFLTNNPDVAHQYTYERAYGDIIGDEPLGEVHHVHVNMRNPYIHPTKPGQKIVDAIEMGRAIDHAKKHGHDGVIVKNIDDSIGQTGDMGDTYVAFHPTQIKSAVGNNGQYDPNEPEIDKAEGGEVDVQYDNPGGNWLKHQREDAEAVVQKRGNIGASGALTAWSKPVHVDPAKLSKIPGAMNEQPGPGNPKYDALHKSMSAEGFSHKNSGPLLVGINHRGEPYILEGNNRAAVARDLGVKSIPAEFRWFAGGEQADGFRPEHIKSLMPDITKAEGGEVEETVPEAPHTLESQLQAFLQGKRKAVLYTHDEPELPKGAGRLETAHGVFHYNPALIDEPAIKAAVAGDRINDVLGIGPYSKKDVLNRVSAGESPLAVVGRDAEGREVVSAAGTHGTANEQASAIAAQLPTGGQVHIESPANVLFERIAAMRSPEQGNKDARKALMIARAMGGRTAKAEGGEIDNVAPMPAPVTSGPKTVFSNGGKQYEFAVTPPEKQITTKGLAAQTTAALQHHLSLPYMQQVANSKAAANKLAPYVGRDKKGAVKPFLTMNAKLEKASAGYEAGPRYDAQAPLQLPGGIGVETIGMPLSPAYEHNKFKVCPNSAVCKDDCLGVTSGNYAQDDWWPRQNSKNRTHAFMSEPGALAVQLHNEIQNAKHAAAMRGNKLAVRLNVLSDIDPRVHETLIKANPDVDFYDYTKMNYDPIAPNHHYTYSSTGLSQPGGGNSSVNGLTEGVENKHQNWEQMRDRLDTGSNVAMVFSHKEHLPREVYDRVTQKTYRVVDGTTHDYRPLDKQPEGSDGVIIGLQNLNKTGKQDNAYKDSNGFVVHYDPQVQMVPNKKTGLPTKTAVKGPSPGLNKKGSSLPRPTFPTNYRVEIAPQGGEGRADGGAVNHGQQKIHPDYAAQQFHNFHMFNGPESAPLAKGERPAQYAYGGPVEGDRQLGLPVSQNDASKALMIARAMGGRIAKAGGGELPLVGPTPAMATDLPSLRSQVPLETVYQGEDNDPSRSWGNLATPPDQENLLNYQAVAPVYTSRVHELLTNPSALNRMKMGRPQQWVKALQRGGAKPEEINMYGIGEGDPNTKISRDEVHGRIAGKIPQLREKLLGGGGNKSDLEVNYGDWETEEPDDQWLYDNAVSRRQGDIHDNRHDINFMAPYAEEAVDSYSKKHLATANPNNVQPEQIKGFLHHALEGELLSKDTAEDLLNAAKNKEVTRKQWRDVVDEMNDSQVAKIEREREKGSRSNGDMADHTKHYGAAVHALHGAVGEQMIKHFENAAMDDNEALNDLTQQERENYYEDRESPQIRTASVTNLNGRDLDYEIRDSGGYGGDIYVTDRRGNHIGNADSHSEAEELIRSHASKLLGMSGKSDGQKNIDKPNVHDVGVYGEGSQYSLPGVTDFREHTLHFDPPTGRDFSEGHYDPNAVVHMRYGTVNDANGKRLLYLDELQSDWHQKGMSRGYDTPEGLAAQKTAQVRYDAAEKELEGHRNHIASGLGFGGTGVGADEYAAMMVMTPEDADEHRHVVFRKYASMGARNPDLARAMFGANSPDVDGLEARKLVKNFQDYSKSAFGDDYKQHALALNSALEKQKNLQEAVRGNLLPDAPWKNTSEWSKLAMKRALRIAADYGYDGVALSPGWVQKERWGNKDHEKTYDDLMGGTMKSLAKQEGLNFGTASIPLLRTHARNKGINNVRYDRAGSGEVTSRDTSDQAHAIYLEGEHKDKIRKQGFKLFKQGGYVPMKNSPAVEQALKLTSKSGATLPAAVSIARQHQRRN